MARHLMVDLETMAVTPRATILTLGAVIFDPQTDDSFDDLYLKFDIDDQDKLGREVDEGTLEWWSKQDPKIMEEAFSSDGRISLIEGVEAFHKFAWGCDAFWSHGSIFDIAMLDDLYRQLNKVTPWHEFWRIRDTRTLFDQGFYHDMPKGDLHNALADAKRQAIGVQNVNRQIRNLKK